MVVWFCRGETGTDWVTLPNQKKQHMPQGGTIWTGLIAAWESPIAAEKWWVFAHKYLTQM
jgi:hypothetical protein